MAEQDLIMELFDIVEDDMEAMLKRNKIIQYLRDEIEGYKHTIINAVSELENMLNMDDLNEADVMYTIDMLNEKLGIDNEEDWF